jgi:hypothetical protein
MERGDLSSDVMLQVARRVRQDPVQLAASITHRLEGMISGWRVWSERGFINSYPLELSFSGNPVKSDQSPQERTGGKARSMQILVPRPLRQDHPWSYLRLIAGALVQARCAQLLGCRVELIVGQIRVVIDPSVPLDAALVRGVLKGAAAAPPASTREVQEAVASFPTDGNATYVWLTPTGVAKREILLSSISTGKDQKSLQVISPNGGWFIAPPDSDFDFEVACSVDDALWPLLLHLAGPVTARDIDPYVGRYKEFDNLVWSAAALRERVAHSFPSVVAQGEQEPVLLQNTPRCGLLRAAWLMGPRLQDAACFGTVREYVAGVVELLATAHAILLAPGQTPDPRESLRWACILSASEAFNRWFSMPLSG